MRVRAESKYYVYDIVHNGVVYIPSDGERTGWWKLLWVNAGGNEAKCDTRDQVWCCQWSTGYKRYPGDYRLWTAYHRGKIRLLRRRIRWFVWKTWWSKDTNGSLGEERVGLHAHWALQLLSLSLYALVCVCGLLAYRQNSSNWNIWSLRFILWTRTWNTGVK
jgi:hypothetical protein